jgi:hypothetical protein
VDERSVGRYEILRRIGQGGMATVYLARQTDLDRDVALKELNVVDGSDPRVAQRFLREARLAGSLSHPNIVTVHDFFQFGGKPYIAMEYVARGSLRPYVGRMSLPQVGGVIEGMLAALAYAEERRIVHRDLKPENVMVTAEGGVKIADFGIAKATSAVQDPTLNLTATGTTLGTPNYIAPEQAMAQELGPGTDLYALGVMVWEFFAGRVPFYDTDEPVAIAMRHVNEAIPPVSALRPDVDPAISAWVERLLIKDRAARTDSAGRAADELDEIMLGVLGPRWRREAALPARPGVGAAAAADAVAGRRMRTAAVVGAGAALGAGAAFQTGAGFHTFAPTTHRLPPDGATQRLPPEQPTTPMRPHRVRNTVLAGLAVIAVIALLSGFLSSGKGTPQQPTPSAPASAPAKGGSSTPAATTAPGATAPAGGTTQAPAAGTGTGTGTAPAAGSGKTNPDENTDDASDNAGDSASP